MCSGGLHAAGLAHKLVCFAQDFWKVSISETTWMMLVLRLAASSFLVGSRCSKSAIALFSSFVTNMWGALKPLQTLPSAHALCALDIFCSPSPMQAMHILSSSRSSRAASWDTLDPAPVRWCVHCAGALVRARASMSCTCCWCRACGLQSCQVLFHAIHRSLPLNICVAYGPTLLHRRYVRQGGPHQPGRAWGHRELQQRP